VNVLPKKKIVHVITGLNTGGAEMMLCTLLEQIDRERFDSVVISLMDHGSLGARLEVAGIPVRTLSMSPGRPTPAAIRRLVRILREEQPDLIQGWMYHGNLASSLASVFLPGHVPVLWALHHSPYQLQYVKRSTAVVIRLSAAFSRYPEKILYVANASADQHEFLGYSSEQRIVIPNGFDTEKFSPSPAARAEVRERLGLGEDAFLIGLIGRLHPMKDHGNFLRAAGILHKNHPDAHFVMIGRDVTPEHVELTAPVAELGIENRVHLLGERQDVPTWMAGLDVLASSSYAEGFSIVVGEAMSSGVPCVVTDVGDSAWLVGDTGRVVPPKDADRLAEAFAELAALPSHLRHELGAKARERVQTLFSLPAVVAQYEALYDSVPLPTSAALAN
jgi:glycosyltransferase involved in cell wall biosynthesis